MTRPASVTKAEIARAFDIATAKWGDDARVIINHDERQIVIERAKGQPTPVKPQLAPRRKMVL